MILQVIMMDKVMRDTVLSQTSVSDLLAICRIVRDQQLLLNGIQYLKLYLLTKVPDKHNEDILAFT